MTDRQRAEARAAAQRDERLKAALQRNEDQVRADARFNEAVEEMRRMTDVLLRSSKKYERREAWVRDQHAAGKQNYSGDIDTVLSNDLLLKNHSGTGRLAADFIAGLGTFIQTELALRARRNQMIGSLNINGLPSSFPMGH